MEGEQRIWERQRELYSKVNQGCEVGCAGTAIHISPGQEKADYRIASKMEKVSSFCWGKQKLAFLLASRTRHA